MDLILLALLIDIAIWIDFRVFNPSGCVRSGGRHFGYCNNSDYSHCARHLLLQKQRKNSEKSWQVCVLLLFSQSLTLVCGILLMDTTILQCSSPNACRWTFSA